MNKGKVVSLLATGAVAALLCLGVPEEPEPQQPPKVVVATEPVVALVHATNAPKAPVVYEPPAEPVVEEEFDPVRSDIPLDEDTQLLLYEACEKTGVGYELALSVIKRETDFRNIKGDGGDSIGYMQIQPRWHGERMERLGVSDLADPYGNFLVGCDYLAELMDKERGLEWALHAYNGGPSYANEMAKADKVSQYATDVLNYMNKIMEVF